MAITAPWDLVTAETVPDTVEWWSLRGQPAYPVTLESLLAQKNIRISFQVEYGPPTVDPAGHVAWRLFTVVWSTRALISQDGITMGYAAIVDLTLAFPLLASFAVQPPLDIEVPGDVMLLKGNLQAFRY
jgi:hypothetical protein